MSVQARTKDTTVGTTVRRFEQSDQDEIGALLQEAFLRVPISSTLWETEGFVITDGPIGATLLAPVFGVYFGGRNVSCGGITGMAVAAEQRGKGIGATLIRQVLEEQRSNGVLLSILYPSSLGFYRRLGYECAGTHTRYQAPCSVAPPAPDILPAKWSDADLDEVARFYDAFARTQNGLIARPTSWWRERVLASHSDSPLYRYVARENGVVTGYCVMTHEAVPGHGVGYLRDAGYHYASVFRDLVWCTESAARSLLGLAAAQRALGSDMLWHAAPEEPLTLFFTDASVAVRWAEPLMARIIDVQGALRARGYPAGVEAAVTFVIDDPWFAGNCGPFRLTVTNGDADVQLATPSRVSRLSIDIGAFTSLYTGHLSANDLARAGRLRNASAADITALNAVFRGPKPWLLEHF